MEASHLGAVPETPLVPASEAIARPQPLLTTESPLAPFGVLVEDADLLAVDKPAGVVVHPAYRHPDGTLWNAVVARQATRGEAPPWLLHRLDRETSGVVLFAKREAARRALVRQFERHLIVKVYLAVAAGVLPEEAPRAGGEIDLPLCRDPADRRRVIVDPGGQAAVTRYRVAGRAGRFALVVLSPRTGRTHQLRAHLAAVGAPLVGDHTYLPAGDAAGTLAPRVMLHAWHLGIRTPGTGAPRTITAPLPADLLAVVSRLGLSAALASLADLPVEALCN